MLRRSSSTLAICLALIATPNAVLAAEDNNDQSHDDRRNTIIVTGQIAEDTVLAAKADIPVLENSQAISIISKETLNEQAVRRLPDALRNVAGVSSSGVAWQHITRMISASSWCVMPGNIASVPEPILRATNGAAQRGDNCDIANDPTDIEEEGRFFDASRRTYRKSRRRAGTGRLRSIRDANPIN